MKKALFIVFFLTAAAFGQASRFDNAAQTTLAGGVVITSPLAVVTACNFPATVIAGQACTNKASICTGIAGSCSTTGNPVTADSQGNFGFWLLPGAYDYTVCPVGGTCSSPVHLVISPTTASNVTWTGTHSFSTPPTFTGPLGIASGGTNNNSFNTNGVAFFNGSQIASTLAGGAGTLALCETSGGIPFFGNCTITGTGTPLISNTPFPASAGAIRLASSDVFNFRKSDNLSNINGLSKLVGDVVKVGDTPGVSIAGPFSLAGAISMALGGNPVANTGFINSSKGFSLAVRNLGNTADINLIGLDGSDHTVFGNAGVGSQYIFHMPLESSGDGPIIFDAGTTATQVFGILGSDNATAGADMIRIKAGRGTTNAVAGGPIEITAGSSKGLQGGGVSITAGQGDDGQGGAPPGTGIGGDVTITAGQGSSQGGNVHFVTGFASGGAGHGGDIVLDTSSGITPGTIKMGNYIEADWTGVKHKRFGATCNTAAAVGATCNTAYSWVTGFGGATTYTVVCTLAGTAAGVPVISNINNKTTNGFNLQIAALTAVIASDTEADCIAFLARN